MQNVKYTYLRALFNHFAIPVNPSIAPYLPEKELSAVTGIPLIAGDPIAFLNHSQAVLKSLHYSWIHPLLETISQADRTLLLAALPTTTRSKLCTMMKLPAPAADIHPLFHSYFLRAIASKMRLDQVLPLPFLPESSLNLLACKPKAQLVEIIDMLSMYDLAEEVRHMLDKRKLKMIYQMLDSKKLQFVRQCLQRKERVSGSKLGLEKFSGDNNQLKMILHQRGIIRLSKALAGQHPDLLWHIAHALDIGRGTILLKYYEEKAVPQVTPFLVDQVQIVLSNINNESTD